MSDRLFGRAGVVRLVRDLAARPEAADPPEGRHSPVLVCEGPPGTGKTVLLSALVGLLHGRVPYAHADLEGRRDGVPELLTGVAGQLARRCGRYGRLRFPRLATARALLVGDDPMSTEDSGHTRQDDGELLWTALLSDLRDAYAHSRRADEWSMNGVLLLDNVDTELGRDLLAGLIRARAQAGPDPLTVVATSRGGLLAELGGGTHLSIIDGEPARRRPARDGGGNPRWLRCRLPDLTLAEVNTVITAAGGDLRTAAAVRQLTLGHPGATRRLADALATDPAARLAGPAALPGILAGPAGQQIFDSLLTDVPAETVEDLVTLSAAASRVHGMRLATHSDLLGRVTTAAPDDLTTGLWTSGRLGPPTLLRRLLLRRLAERPDTHAARWSRVHAWLAADSGQRAGSIDADLYYKVAMGRFREVASSLAQRLAIDDGPVWLDRLEVVTQAPRHPRGGHPDGGSGTAPRAIVRRLVIALCDAADPLKDTDRFLLYGRIASHLADLARYAGTGTDLDPAIRRYQRRAGLWQSGPRPETVTQEGRRPALAAR